MNSISLDWKKSILLISPLLVGTLAFFLIIGPRALNPSNIAWLNQGDTATHYLGWLFFRNSAWSFPLGLNPKYGLELSNSIVFSDSIPLLAILLKPFSFFLPTTFQYFGFWLLICFVMQAWFGWKLVGTISSSSSVRLLGASLFVFSPVMVLRTSEHLSLTGHFLVVAALYLSISSKFERRPWAWGLLIVTASLVHAYLLAMVLLIWFASIVGSVVNRSNSIRHVATEIIGTVVLLGVICWQAGYFSVGEGTVSGGFGLYRMNLLSIIDSNGWSYILKDIPTNAGEAEGFNFLGLGVLILILFSLPIVVSRHPRLAPIAKSNAPLFIAMLSLTAFAASNNIGIGSHEFVVPLPDWATRIANIFRASGRMFWPVVYVILFTAITLVVQGFGKRAAIMLMSFTVAIQVVDTSKVWLSIRKNRMIESNSIWTTQLINPFWAEASTMYAKVRIVPSGMASNNWQDVANYAGSHNLATDAAYLGRFSTLAIANSQKLASELLQNGALQEDSLYILDDASLRRFRVAIDPKSDFLGKIDGVNVIAPKWKECMNCPSINSEMSINDFFPLLDIGKRISFSHSAKGRDYLGVGWGSPEGWGTWAESSNATIAFRLPSEKATFILLETKPLVSSKHPRQRMNVKVNGVDVESFSLSRPNDIVVINLSDIIKQMDKHAVIKLDIELPDSARPTDIGLGKDSRNLSIGLIAMTLH